MINIYEKFLHQKLRRSPTLHKVFLLFVVANLFWFTFEEKNLVLIFLQKKWTINCWAIFLLGVRRFFKQKV